MRYFFSFFLIPILSFAQIDSLEAVQIKVKPAIAVEGNPINAPFSISSKDFKNSSDAKQQISLDEYFNNVPGLFVLSKNNYSQDLRVSIRGFGARSAFGIRGIKIVVDGIPETTPDGQGQIDNLTLGIIDKLQILRGPASLLYGNASGGTINIQTIRSIDSSYIQLGSTIGNYGMYKLDAIAALKSERGTTIIAGSRTTTDGYRDFSGFETTQFNVRSSYNLSTNDNLNFQINYTDSPFAQDAGGLNIEAVNQNRRQAREANVLFDSGEQVRQFKTGLSYDKKWGDLGFNSYGFYSYRDFNNKLPFESGGQVALYRNYYGHGSYLTLDSNNSSLSNKIQLGYALAWQADQRQRFDNLEGSRGNSNFDQLETFNAYGFYLIDSFKISKWTVQGGLRYDINVLKADDRTQSLNNSSQNLNAWSGSLGVNYELQNNTALYGNVSTSFETPALTELSSNPDGGTGFNTDLDPQKAVNYEIGFKQNQTNFNLNIAAFYIATTDDLVPFELAAFPDRTFYRNAGSSDRYGIELFADFQIADNISAQGSYTYSDFTYDDYTLGDSNLAGNDLPGIPNHLATLGLTYQSNNGLFIQLNNNYRGSLFADDQNNTRIDDAIISDLSMSLPIKWNGLQFTLHGGVNNIFDTTYYDNVRINAFGNRYYEPAPGINFYTGVRVRI